MPEPEIVNALVLRELPEGTETEGKVTVGKSVPMRRDLALTLAAHGFVSLSPPPVEAPHPAAEPEEVVAVAKDEPAADKGKPTGRR